MIFGQLVQTSIAFAKAGDLMVFDSGNIQTIDQIDAIGDDLSLHFEKAGAIGPFSLKVSKEAVMRFIRPSP